MIETRRPISQFFLYGCLAALIFLSFYLIEPLRARWHDTARIVPQFEIFFAFTVIALLLLSLLYILAYRRFDREQPGFRRVALFAVLFNLIAPWLWPVASLDIFNYTNYARVASYARANPYVEVFSDFPADPLYQAVKTDWSSKPSPYGPLFTLISAGLSHLAGDSLFLHFFFFKLLAIVLNLANFFLIFYFFRDIKAAFLYGWNPLLLFEFGVNGHNDVLTIFFMILTAGFFLKLPNLKGRLLSALALALAVLTKFVPIIFAPFLYLYSLAREQGKKRIIYGLAAPLLAAAAAAVAYAPFWQGTKTIFGTAYISNLALLAGQHCLVKAAPLISLISCGANLFGQPYFIDAASIVGKIVFFTGYWLLAPWFIKKLKVPEDKTFFQTAAISLALFYTCFLTILHPWYLANLIALIILLAAVAKDYDYTKYIFFLNFWAAFYYLIIR